MAPILKSFCCCDLRRGTIAYGTFLTVPCFFDCIICIYDLVTTNNKHDLGYTAASLSLGAAFFGVLVNGCLLYGACTRSKYFLLPWLVVTCIGISTLTTYCVILMFAFPICILILLLSVFIWYLWLCVLSFYQSLESPSPDQPIVIMTYERPMNVCPPTGPHPLTAETHPGQFHPGQPHPGQPHLGQPLPVQFYPAQPLPAQYLLPQDLPPSYNFVSSEECKSSLADQQDSSQPPSFQQISFQHPSFQQPSFQQPPFQQPSFQQPPFQQSSFQQPSFQPPPFESVVLQPPPYEFDGSEKKALNPV